MRSITPTLLLSAFLLFPAFSAVSERTFIDEPEQAAPSSVEDRDTEWKEGVTSLPPWPQDGDLVEFQVDDPESRFRQYIDGKHIRVGADGAVRYTLVVESPSGARNVSFEGLRCTPQGAVKIYAYGNKGRFEKTTGDWIRIQGQRRNEIHRELHKQILCIPRKFEPRPEKDMIRAMRTRIPHEANTGFLPD